ncbi:MFS transporter [Ectobacillus ponti]|uniref:MFS transporter n=1 Tax=Ectobacillus ponti TaxID=2961894 RepID=A0AA41XCQ0_9BACI|nr:MFS transporter [Ectobacillus ponti]MCP8971268.1 MFS transporter [Ectobacillus ponti]
MIFQNRTFRYLFMSYGVSLLGTCFSTIAVNLWILQTTGSARLMFLFFLTSLLVTICFGSIAGTVADRYNRRTIMWAGDLCNAAIAGTIAVCMYMKFTPYPLIIAVCALQVFVGLFHQPAFQASLSSILEKELIPKAMGAITIVDNIARILGLAAGGTIVGFFGAATAFVFDAATYLISSLLVLAAGTFPVIVRQKQQKEVPAEKQSFLADFQEGLRVLWGEPFARSFMIMMPLVASFFMMSLMMIQVSAVKIWHASPLQFGLMEACVPFGYIIGSGLLMKYDSRLVKRGYWIFAGFLSLGPIYLVISQVTGMNQAFPIIFVLGFMFALCTLLMNVALRMEIPHEVQGRAFGMIGTLTSPIMTIAIGIATYFSDRMGPQPVLVASGLLLTAVAVLLTIVLKPLRTYRAEEKEQKAYEIG